jgi:hypothetical protein
MATTVAMRGCVSGFDTALNDYGMPDEAKVICQEAEKSIQAHPSSPLALQLARAYLSMGTLDGADKYSQLALSLNADCSLCDLTLAEISE